MQGEQRLNGWVKAAVVGGILLAVTLTALIWFQVIDRQATAMLRGEEVVTGTPRAGAPSRVYELPAEAAPSPIP